MKKSAVWVLAIAGAAIYVLVNHTGQPSQQPGNATASTTSTRSMPVAPTISCERGQPGGDTVAVREEVYPRTTASDDGDRIRNAKASEALGKTHYHVIDTSTTVRRLCVDENWTQVQVTEPNWLTHVKGWVPNSSLRTIERTASGTRIYEESDFYWDSDASQYKPQIVAAVNRIARENSRCTTMDTGTVALSPSRGGSGDPVFFITCGTGANAFNVWFSPSDGDEGSSTSFAAIQAIDRGAAIIACEQAAKDRASHPSTVDFSRFMDVSYSEHASGRVSLESSFTARNSFNLELKHDIRCLFEGRTLIEATVVEAR